MYVVCATEHLRDGREHWASVVGTEQEALALISKHAQGIQGTTMSFQLFRLGEEIPIRRETVETPQPPVEQVRYVVAKKSKRGNPTEGPK